MLKWSKKHACDTQLQHQIPSLVDPVTKTSMEQPQDKARLLAAHFFPSQQRSAGGTQANHRNTVTPIPQEKRHTWDHGSCVPVITKVEI